MQIITQRPLGEIQATLYRWNGKYLLKLEIPLLEQTYKWSEMDVTGESEVLGLLDDAAFVTTVKERFAAMQADLARIG